VRRLVVVRDMMLFKVMEEPKVIGARRKMIGVMKAMEMNVMRCGGISIDSQSQ
jgi:hypothetical protein